MIRAVHRFVALVIFVGNCQASIRTRGEGDRGQPSLPGTTDSASPLPLAATPAISKTRAVTDSSITRNWTIADLSPCTLRSVELRRLTNTENIDPCILADTGRNNDDNHANKSATDSDLVVTLLHLTNHNCANHRDGTWTAVAALNAANQGRGVPVGYFENRYAQFRLVTIFVGNSNALGIPAYNALHQTLLRDALENIRPQFIVGTCSPLANNEKELAREYQVALIAAVGPPGFYADANPWVFGFHIDSDEYTLAAVRSLYFWSTAQKEEYNKPSQFPISVIYRTQSEFFYSTCQAAIDALRSSGFSNIRELLYDPAADHDGDGVHNQIDEDFLHGLADQACAIESQGGPADDSSGDTEMESTSSFHPALFVCTSDEHDILLQRLRDIKCSPSLLWLTAATWTWANQQINQVPYFLGGSQWHASMKYSDPYFQSGVDVLKEVQRVFGYEADYDSVTHYAIPIMLSQHLQSVYRIFDEPDPLGDYGDPQRRESLRRQLLAFTGETIFGPISFDKNQRNNGRGAAASQWLLRNTNTSNLDDKTSHENASTLLYNALVSPLLQAEASMIIPAPSSRGCPAGSFVNLTMIHEQPALLASKCAICTVDTFSPSPNSRSQCFPCPHGTSTLNIEGATHCIRYEDNLLSSGILFFGYFIMCLCWIIGFTLIAWVVQNRSDPIVRLAQTEYLLLILCGAVISSSSILAFSFQAGTDDDTTAATRGCLAAPFLYTIGWIFQYGSLSSKTYRLMKMTNPYMGRVRVTALQSSPVVILALAIDLALVLSWTMINPLEYRRETISEILGDDHVLTIESSGRCRTIDPDGVSAAAFVIPILCHHLFLMLATNFALYLVRKVHSRYQERKYLLLASIFVLEVVVIGMPVLFAAQDSIEASYVVQVGIVGLADIGVMLFIFLPKVRYQRKGLQAGIAVGESIMANSHRKARERESNRSEILRSVGLRSSAQLISSRSSAAENSGDDSLELIDVKQQACGQQTAERKITTIFEESKEFDSSHRADDDLFPDFKGSRGESHEHIEVRPLSQVVEESFASRESSAAVSASLEDHDHDTDDAARGNDGFLADQGEIWAHTIISRLTQNDSVFVGPSQNAVPPSEGISTLNIPYETSLLSAGVGCSDSVDGRGNSQATVEDVMTDTELRIEPSTDSSSSSPFPVIFDKCKQQIVQQRISHMKARVVELRTRSSTSDCAPEEAEDSADRIKQGVVAFSP